MLILAPITEFDYKLDYIKGCSLFLVKRQMELSRKQIKWNNLVKAV